VEKNSVVPGVAGIPKKLDRVGLKHESEALILMDIRGSRRKRLKKATKAMIRPKGAEYRCQGRVRLPPPLILYEYQKKGVTEFAFRKSLILKGVISVVLD